MDSKQLLLTLNTVLLESPHVATGLDQALRILLDYLGCDIACRWRADYDSLTMHCTHIEALDSSTWVEFASLSMARKFAPGEGGPGRAWLSRRSAYARVAPFGPLVTATAISVVGAWTLATGFVQQGIAAPVPLIAALVLAATAVYHLPPPGHHPFASDYRPATSHQRAHRAPERRRSCARSWMSPGGSVCSQYSRLARLTPSRKAYERFACSGRQPVPTAT